MVALNESFALDAARKCENGMAFMACPKDGSIRVPFGRIGPQNPERGSNEARQRGDGEPEL